MKTNSLSLISKITFTLFAFIALSCSNDSEIDSSDNANEQSIYQMLESSNAPATTERNGAPKKGDESIAEIAIAANFTQLVSALAYVDAELDAGLVDLFLNGTDQYTVFAPTDDAFYALYDGIEGVEDITDLPADLVLNVLLYHVTNGRRASNSVVPQNGVKTIQTLLGESFQVDTDPKIIAIGNMANFVSPDLINISASNGIIHVIDTVLLPFN
ncbi:fasciclin domain-containing protein [Mangrovimonas aestuarii]|uniref:fasciclin domain-containing protein n=1 Tax=Mangrovimonas aestuarii TaxID=3018443 RepID=UPI002378F11B|nr:fasciclin domain-containing protein [Mangrovimonas aestuarii]